LLHDCHSETISIARLMADAYVCCRHFMQLASAIVACVAEAEWQLLTLLTSAGSGLQEAPDTFGCNG
jgi:hypothetical protein